MNKTPPWWCIANIQYYRNGAITYALFYYVNCKYMPKLNIYSHCISHQLPTIMRAIRLVFTFYKLYAFASLVITLSCLSIIYTWGISTFAVLFWFKIITLGLIFYYIQNFKKDKFYYYKNLGLSKKQLWIWTFAFDFILFLILSILTLKIR
jgi:hypothetical protein